MAQWHFKTPVRKIDLGRIYREAKLVTAFPIIKVSLENDPDGDDAILLDRKTNSLLYDKLADYTVLSADSLHTLRLSVMEEDSKFFYAFDEQVGKNFFLYLVPSSKSSILAKRLQKVLDERRKVNVKVTVL